MFEKAASSKQTITSLVIAYQLGRLYDVNVVFQARLIGCELFHSHLPPYWADLGLNNLVQLKLLFLYSQLFKWVQLPIAVGHHKHDLDGSPSSK